MTNWISGIDAIGHMASYVLLGVGGLASIVLLFCALLNYLGAWRLGGQEYEAAQGNWLFVSNWFFYLNAFVCLISMLGLILYI
jgi:hypothetical protein